MARPKYWIPACAGMTDRIMSRLALTLTLLLTACGQSGDLYLPAPEPAPPQAATPATPAPPAPDEDKKKE